MKTQRNSSRSIWKHITTNVEALFGLVKQLTAFSRDYVLFFWWKIFIIDFCRSSCPEVFCKKVFRPATLLNKIFWHRCFPVNFVKFLRTHFYIEHLWWLLLSSRHFFKCSFRENIFRTSEDVSAFVKPNESHRSDSRWR